MVRRPSSFSALPHALAVSTALLGAGCDAGSDDGAAAGGSGELAEAAAAEAVEGAETDQVLLALLADAAEGADPATTPEDAAAAAVANLEALADCATVEEAGLTVTATFSEGCEVHGEPLTGTLVLTLGLAPGGSLSYTFTADLAAGTRTLDGTLEVVLTSASTADVTGDLTATDTEALVWDASTSSFGTGERSVDATWGGAWSWTDTTFTLDTTQSWEGSLGRALDVAYDALVVPREGGYPTSGTATYTVTPLKADPTTHVLAFTAGEVTYTAPGGNTVTVPLP